MGKMLFEHKETKFYMGLLFAIQSTIFIGSSFIIKKKALIKLGRSGCLRAGAGGYGYLKEWMWWLGLITMGIGEAANFAAYAFAPASLVTPLGALSILVSTVLASKYLNEKLNFFGKLGCFLCIVGAIIIILHAPKQEEVESLSELMVKFQNSGFIYYICLVCAMVIVIGCYLGPNYGNKHVFIYVFLCSAIGSLTVMACKALGLAIKEFSSTDSNQVHLSIIFLLVFFVISFIIIQMNYLNKALDLFNTNIVTPVFYVFFTTLVLTASAILFDEWQSISVKDVLGCLFGFLTVVSAIFLLTTFKNVDLSFQDIFHVRITKQEVNRNGFKSKYGSLYAV